MGWSYLKKILGVEGIPTQNGLVVFFKGNWGDEQKNPNSPRNIPWDSCHRLVNWSNICFRGKAVRTAERKDKDSIPVAEKMQPPWDAAQPPGVDEINQALGELGVDSEWLGVNGWVYDNFGFTSFFWLNKKNWGIPSSNLPHFSGGNGNLQMFSVGLSGSDWFLLEVDRLESKLRRFWGAILGVLLLMVLKSGDHQLRLVVYPIIYRDSMGFIHLRSQVVQDCSHQQYFLDSFLRRCNKSCSNCLEKIQKRLVVMFV